MQFRNVVTEPDSVEFQESNAVENESHEVSREDTMVEHSVVVNEEVKEEDENDYMAALESMKLDLGVFAR